MIARIVSIIAAAGTLSLAAAPGALALSNGGDNSANAPGQANAAANCSAVYHNQFDNGVIAKGGPKSGYGEPQFNTPDNCDHYYGSPGQLLKP